MLLSVIFYTLSISFSNRNRDIVSWAGWGKCHI